jgi:TRAP-type C4-dicarboxylate transport system substrate-binding protein
MDYVNRVWGEKMNVFYLGKSLDQVPYHIFFKKPVTKADLTGMRVRGIPIYKAFIESLGGSTVTLAPGELYTALERGVVEAYGWPAIGVFDLSLQEQTKARIDPGFYNVEIGVLVNQNAWKKLDNKQREYLQKQAIWMEALNLENKKMIAEEVKKQSAAGIQTVELKGAEREAYLKKAYDAVWASILQRSPQHGPKLKELLYKQP